MNNKKYNSKKLSQINKASRKISSIAGDPYSEIFSVVVDRIRRNNVKKNVNLHEIIVG